MSREDRRGPMPDGGSTERYRDFSVEKIQRAEYIRRRDECLPELAENIERLTRLAYSNAAVEMIKVLAKDQFVDALHNEEMRLKVCQS